jgi:hypothetical protein
MERKQIYEAYGSQKSGSLPQQGLARGSVRDGGIKLCWTAAVLH